MIERYTRPQMAALWSEQFKFDTFLKIEIFNAEALHQKGLLSNDELIAIQKNAKFSLKQIHEIEETTKHDVIAFTRAVSESLNDEKRYIHYGLTSTDVVDTANGYILKHVNNLLRMDLERFTKILKQKAFEYKDTFCIGRTHGIHADITIFGLKWALWYDEMQRNIRRFNEAAKDVECGKISGAVGNFAFTEPFVETYVTEKLGIHKANISTQTLQRDRHAHYLSVIALIGATLEKIATEIRHLQRTEVREVSEKFELGQKGSSAMPHKQNPIVSENITGLSRILRGYMIPAYEDVSLWHERDISHSSVERIILPDATTLLDYMLNRYAATLETLIVYPEKMLENINLTHGVIFSQRVLTALIDQGISRELAYDMIQQLALKSYREGLDFKKLVLEDQNITSKLSNLEIVQLFDLNYYKRNIDMIYNQVFIDGE
ncbi:MAG: adenylosuccinate lyase [Tenericutes bacterium HGW-Tenericutes-1]|nr:MAG: adenylosuccinate lyase [Tenericutes bacterium HGW-Tenericutes-1]